jgi:hypothetical protein
MKDFLKTSRGKEWTIAALVKTDPDHGHFPAFLEKIFVKNDPGNQPNDRLWRH